MSSLIDSKHQELSQEEIIAIAAKETGGKYTAEQIKASLTVEAYEMNAVMIREGNTIFVVHPSPERKDVALFRAVNADTIQNYLQNSVKFAKAIGMAGFKYMVTEFEDKSLLNIFKYIGRAQPYQNMGYSIQKAKDRELYRVTVNVGDIENQGGLPPSEANPTAGAL
jgi:hypothetical protein